MKKYLLLLVILPFIFISNVHAQQVPGWAIDIDQFQDVNLLPCYSNGCGNGFNLAINDKYYNNQYNYFSFPYTTSTHKFGDYGDMILTYHRYKAGYLYNFTSYVCFSASMNAPSVDMYTGGYSEVVNKTNGIISYHTYLTSTLSAQPFAPGDNYSKCYAHSSLFVSNKDGQNVGQVIKATPKNTSTNVYLIGQTFDSLGVYTDTISNNINSIISNSGLATASSVQQIQQSNNQIRQEISGMQQEQQQTNEKLDDLNDNITSEDEPTIDLELDESSNTPISDLILFPITLLNKLINTIGEDTCSPYTLPFFYDTTITFPCFQLSNYLGTSITNSIDLFICLFMCYNLAMLFISIFEDITSLRDTYDSLYEPKHADTGYKPKHGKE